MEPERSPSPAGESSAAAPQSPPASPTRAPKGRIRGVDAARALAVIGMVMVHFGPDTDGDTLPEFLYGSTHGRAAILFGVLAGVGVSLLAGDRSPERLRRLDRKLAVRGAILLPLGLLLQELPHGIAVILQFYAVYFVVAGLAARLPDRWLLGAAGTALAVGPIVIIGSQLRWPEWFETGPAAFGELAEPWVVARDILLSGNYPVVTWSAPVLFGLWLGRRDLRAAAVRWGMVAGGLAAVIVAYVVEDVALLWLELPDDVGWAQLVITYPHSQMAPWLLQATGFAVAVLGVSLLVCDWLPRATWPAVAVGQMALTVYVAHLLLLAAWPDAFFRDTVDGAVYSVGRFMVLTALLAVAWRQALPRGPLELLIDLPTRVRRPS